MTSTLPPGCIVVGVDGSRNGEQALAWAAREAALEGRDLVLLHAVAPPSTGVADFLGSSGIEHGELSRSLRAEAEAALAETAERTRAAYAVDRVHTLVRAGDPRQVLLEAAEGAAMVVVGTRGRGALRQLVLGSVSSAVSKHAEAPVVVVRVDGRRSPGLGVLVGVAGDERDPAVVEFGFRVAAARDLPVTLVHCFWDLVGTPDGAREVAADEPGCEDQRALVEAAARDAAARHPSVPVHLLLSRGFADVQLLRASRRAELVVLGHQRKPFLRELVYGSVAPRVVEHAGCSVAVVAVERRSEEAPLDPDLDALVSEVPDSRARP